MNSKSRPLSKWFKTGILATVIAFCLLLTSAISTFANTVNISDQAGVLNKSQVRNEASSLPYEVDIFTVSNFSGNNSAFDQRARSKTNNNSIVIAINVVGSGGHLAIAGGRSVPLNSSQNQSAYNAFASDFRSNHDYTSATVAALRSLRNDLSNSGGILPVGGGRGGNAFGNSALCCIGILVLAGILFFVFIRRRRGGGGGGGFGGGLFNRRPPEPRYDPPYNQPYNQGPYPPNYGPNYPQQNQGMNPWAAGGLGAAAGGLIGYELGKQSGEREGDHGNWDNQGGNFGGGDNGGGSFGGGDFGGGDSGGGDFGGGDFGGGDFGGGNSGGGDF
ncbi:DUF3824 domain-containing protein [Ktedonosporobacter rubrisoli]|uniref:DUF3824 domain-containing protein n=1 Tax=Ktedonosporobacter rubrisoli TaxID=2509675 RepID=UPI001A917F96|nr:DUF3824 domain-containing protein [Ktedonosporobacter rubrisoli]